VLPATDWFNCIIEPTLDITIYSQNNSYVTLLAVSEENGAQHTQLPFRLSQIKIMQKSGIPFNAIPLSILQRLWPVKFDIHARQVL
jgi:hypothetical protein